MVRALEESGIDALLLPSVEIVPPANPDPLRRAASGMDSYDWVVFTSTAGVRALADLAGSTPPLSPSLAAVGPATARAVAARFGRPVDLAPVERFTGEGLVQAFLDEGVDLAGRRVLLPLAERARDVVPEGLRGMGARVERVVAYRTVPPRRAERSRVRRAIEADAVDLLTFTSPSTAENFLAAVGPAALRVPVAAIGPVTADAAAGLGFEVAGVAGSHTVEGLVGLVVGLLGPPAGGEA